jgi:organic radical activating enzyme
MINEYQQNAENVKKELDLISPSFCVAKWKQVTMHLQNGHTHSCHHPSTHFIPLDEIKRNPTALHNTEFKKLQRKMMLNGERPSECDYCWRVEDSGAGLSDRAYKSAEPTWAYPYIDEIVTTPWDANVDPSYVEVSFSNVCNFKCSYCSPNVSSQWMEEIERYGAYPTSDRFNNLEWIKIQNQMPIPNNQENPYVEAFWNWFPDMYKNLKYFRITGGEPLLNKNTFKVLDYIIDNPNPNLEVAINTNMNPPKELLDKFLEKVAIILDENKLKNFKIFTSSEAHGKQAEYIRYGMNYNDWLANIRYAHKMIPDKLSFTVMSTYNLLSIGSYKLLLKDIHDIKLENVKPYMARSPILVDIPYLRWPTHQTIFLMDKEQLPLIEEQVKFMYSNLESSDAGETAYRGFFEFEADKMKRLYNVAKDAVANPEPNLIKNRKDFVIFVDEHDKRRGTNFTETFPELSNMYTEWKKLC